MQTANPPFPKELAFWKIERWLSLVDSISGGSPKERVKGKPTRRGVAARQARGEGRSRATGGVKRSEGRGPLPKADQREGAD